MMTTTVSHLPYAHASTRHGQGACVRTLLVAITMTLSCNLKAQDIHFSQIDVIPVLYNPAYTGFFDGNGRFSVCYRNQWSSVSKAFQTVAATAEYVLKRRRYYHDGFSMGLILFSDRAGTLHYGTTSGSLILSYFKGFGKSNDNIVSIAAEAGLGQAGFNTTDIELNDPTESFETLNANFMTLGTGIAWFYQPNDNYSMKIGISGRNLNRPDISYLDSRDSYIERKYNCLVRAEIKTWSDISLLPLATCMIQNNYKEITLGCSAKWYISESSDGQFCMSGGLYYRMLDAAMAEFTVEYNALLFALTYDANISKLTPASHSIGAFELALSYRLSKKRNVRRRALPCPII